MSVIITNVAKETMLSAVSGSDLKAALMGSGMSTETSAQRAYTNWSEISGYEASGTGYTAGGVNLSGTSAYFTNYPPVDAAWFDGESITWAAVTLSAYGMVIYRETNGLVVEVISFTSAPLIVNNGSFSVSWSTNHIMQMVG